MSDEMMKQPIRIGNVEVANRLVQPPLQNQKATPDDGLATDATLDFYDSRSKGGAIGLVVVEHSYVSPEGRFAPGQLANDKDECVTGLAKIAAILHANGSKCVQQLAHAGSASMPDGGDVIAPSAIANNVHSNGASLPREMTQDDIERLKGCFVKAALRSQEAGMDGVELHGAHAYLLSQFYSPAYNKRTDAYTGQTLDGRLRFHLEILKAIRAAVRPDFLVGIRFGAHDYTVPGGAPACDVPAAVGMLAATGIDFLDISGGMNGAFSGWDAKPGYFTDSSAMAKANCSVPVIVTGGVKTTAQAEEILESGKADMVGVGRPLFAKPDWARNAML